MAELTVLEKAIALAVERHAGQRDEAGEPRILHVLGVMLQMPDEPSRITAVLYYLVQDGGVTLPELEAIGVEGEALEALRLLTHDREMSYYDHLRRLRLHRIARAVKRADTLDKMQTTRVGEPPPPHGEPIERYRAALMRLQGDEMQKFRAALAILDEEATRPRWPTPGGIGQ